VKTALVARKWLMPRTVSFICPVLFGLFAKWSAGESDRIPQNLNEKFPVTTVGISGKLAVPRIFLRYYPDASGGRTGRR
jgi:hypothetical protein